MVKFVYVINDGRSETVFDGDTNKVVGVATLANDAMDASGIVALMRLGAEHGDIAGNSPYACKGRFYAADGYTSVKISAYHVY